MNEGIKILNQKLDAKSRKKFNSFLLERNMGRGFVLQIAMSAILSLLILLGATGLLNFTNGIMQSQLIMFAVMLFFLVALFIAKKLNNSIVKYVLVTLVQIMYLALTMFFYISTYPLGDRGFVIYLLGILIVNIVFIRKPYITVLLYLATIIIITAYLNRQTGGNVLQVPDYINVWVFTIVAIIGIILNYFGSKKLFIQSETIKKNNVELKRLSVTDDLTKVYNKRKLNEELEREIELAKRYGLDLSVILIDIDHFKNVNDTYGHNVGDVVLKEFARLLKELTRNTDIVGRWGGEEFLIICAYSNADITKNLAERLLEAIRTYKFSDVGEITFSAGVAQHKEGCNRTTLVKRSDDAMYRAKENGRNQIMVD
jgi:diguanylate cyclase (GGDEF)-like protein